MRYGWIRDLPDIRDQDFLAAIPHATLPDEFDLATAYPDRILPILDQGDIGSCVFNAGVSLVYYDMVRQKLLPFMPSRLQWYYNTRVREHTVKSDSGATITDACKVFKSKGVCPEAEWTYTEENLFKKPSVKAAKDALSCKGLKWEHVHQNNNALQQMLYAGNPIIFGISVYDSFESKEAAKTGMIPMPRSDETLLGGHGISMTGWSDKLGAYRCRNSWGTGWGDKGWFWLPYKYVEDPNLAADFKVITLIG